MSWLARSLANSLKPYNDNDDDEEEPKNIKKSNEEEGEISSESGRGVKEDLSELTKTLTRQLWGVASFLAPPPSEPSSPKNSDPSISDQSRSEPFDPSVSKDSELESSDSPRIAGIRSDFAEIGGRFKTGISRLSSNKAVTEISKIASSFLPFGIDEESEEKYSVGEAIGVTDEVLTFARNISMHPETWLDFPLFGDDEDSDDNLV